MILKPTPEKPEQAQ